MPSVGRLVRGMCIFSQGCAQHECFVVRFMINRQIEAPVTLSGWPTEEAPKHVHVVRPNANDT